MSNNLYKTYKKYCVSFAERESSVDVEVKCFTENHNLFAKYIYIAFYYNQYTNFSFSAKRRNVFATFRLSNQIKKKTPFLKHKCSLLPYYQSYIYIILKKVFETSSFKCLTLSSWLQMVSPRFE